MSKYVVRVQLSRLKVLLHWNLDQPNIGNDKNSDTVLHSSRREEDNYGMISCTSVLSVPLVKFNCYDYRGARVHLPENLHELDIRNWNLSRQKTPSIRVPRTRQCID